MKVHFALEWAAYKGSREWSYRLDKRSHGMTFIMWISVTVTQWKQPNDAQCEVWAFIIDKWDHRTNFFIGNTLTQYHRVTDAKKIDKEKACKTLMQMSSYESNEIGWYGGSVVHFDAVTITSSPGSSRCWAQCKRSDVETGLSRQWRDATHHDLKMRYAHMTRVKEYLW